MIERFVLEQYLAFGSRNERYVTHSKEQMLFHSKWKPIWMLMEHPVYQKFDHQMTQYPKNVERRDRDVFFNVFLLKEVKLVNQYEYHGLMQYQNIRFPSDKKTT